MKKETKIGILSLGCPRNLVDSETILGRLNLKGYPIVDIGQADIAVVNTCAFIEDAKRESIDVILDLIELKKQGKLKKIIVYGCLAQRYKNDLSRELPQIDAFVGRVSLNHEVNRYAITPEHYAYLKICEGCVNNCSFCSIPKIKGGLSSLDMDSILNKVDRFNKEGLCEINIIGQDITGYGLDLKDGLGLSELVSKIAAKAKNIGWIRLLYLYPERITDELLRVIKDSPGICKYIDLPLQHINDRVLKLMNRKTNKRDILRLIARIRQYIPEAAIRTSIIVGFPSESEEEFNELLQFVEDVRFERLGAFIYSREEGTAAYDFKGQLSAKIKTERLNRIMCLQQEISRQLNKKFLGKTMDVLIEEKENGMYLGRSQYDAPEVDGLVYVNSKRQLKQGDFVEAKITDTLEYDLVGEV